MASVAIVGISVELPSGVHSDKNLDYQSFIQFLLEGKVAYQRIPFDRFNIDAWYGEHTAQIKADTGTFLKHINLFDNVEFGVSSKDALNMAPATRKLLENCFLALLDSGIDYRTRNVGCFSSGNSHDYMNVSEPDEYEARGSFSGHPSMIANRISLHLDLLGPSVPTDTACSSTLTAFHLAIQAVSHGEIDAAVVGGCQLNHRFMDWFTYSQGSLLAKDGMCKPFDASADGFSRGEGCVAIVIKPLSDALRDHDRIYASVLGTAINSSGGGGPPNAPVADAQRDAMRRAFKRAGRQPQDVDFVELHATGTAKGDPTEANWVGADFCRADELLVGSTKANIGHTEIVAFFASLSKVLAMIELRMIPPAVNIRSFNPAIKWDEYKLRVPLHPTALPCRGGVSPLISLASSGIGGSNGHVVIEGPPRVSTSSIAVAEGGPVLLMACGLSSRSASAIAESLQKLIDLPSMDLHALSTVLGRRSRQMTWRSYALVERPLVGPIPFSTPQYCPRAKNALVILFSGQGPQHIDMGRELFAKFPAFRESVTGMDDVFKRLTGKSIIEDHGLFNGRVLSTSDDTWPISLILPSITIFQIAFFDLISSLGVRPDIVLGHSAGETAVLYASGAGSKAMAVELAILRGEAFSSLELLGGTMAAIACSPEEVKPLIDVVLREHSGSVLEVACYNSPSAVAVSGDQTAIEHLLLIAKDRGYFCRKIRTRVPIHSSMMEHCKQDYVVRLQNLFERYPGPHMPQIPTYSTLTGDKFEGPYTAEYFWLTTRNPVRFTKTIQGIARSSPSTIVEVSPHPVLSSYVVSMAHETDAVFASTRRARAGQPSSEYRDALELCAQLTATGQNCVDFTILNGRACYDLKVPLPEYPFLRKVFPLYPDTRGYIKQIEPHRGPLNHRYLKVNRETHPILGEHIIRGQPIMPAAGFMEMALEFGATALMHVSMRSILSLSAEKPIKVDVRLDGSRWTVETTAPSKRTSDKSPRPAEKVHADGYLTFEPSPDSDPVDITAVRRRCKDYTGSSFYRTLAYFSDYGPHFRRVTNVYYGHREALVSVRGLDDKLESDGRYLLHPAILDACLHVTGHEAFHGDFNPNTYYLPAHVDAVILHRPSQVRYFPAHVYAHVLLKEWTPSSVYYDIIVVDDVGKALCTMQRLEVAKHHINPPADISIPYEIVLQAAPSFATKATVSHSTAQYPHCVTSVNSGVVPQLKSLTTPSTQAYGIEMGLFNVSTASVFRYSLGHETRLQGELARLDSATPADVWIISKDGHCGDAALGLVRALRHEYPTWTLRLVVFPVDYTEDACTQYLLSLPSTMQDERDIIVDADGHALVPRMAPLPSSRHLMPATHSLDAPQCPPGAIRLDVCARSDETALTSVYGFANQCGGDIQTRQPAIGLILGDHHSNHIHLDPRAFSYVPPRLNRHTSGLVQAVPGLVTAILAQGLHNLNIPERVGSLRVLVTHSSTITANSIGRFYASQSISVVTVQVDTSLLELSSLQHQPFDLILSGHQDPGYIQVLQSLLVPGRGKMHLWADSLRGPAALLHEDPWAVHDALMAAIVFFEEHIEECERDVHVLANGDANYLEPSPTPPSIFSVYSSAGDFTCDANKTYLILGGIGSLGVHIALLLYQRGARQITLTSRRGAESLHANTNRIVKRIFEFLEGLPDLRIRLEAVDASSHSSMEALVRSLPSELGGCIVLTAVLRDRTFLHLGPSDFEDVFASKTSVIQALVASTDVASLDFLVAFSSVVGLFGNGGQANYGAANTAMEAQISSFENAFSFICPGIIDSSLMLAGKDPSVLTHLNHFSGWSITSEEMCLWFEDALSRFQRGERFARYIPSLDWEAVDRTIGMPVIGRHLLSVEEQEVVTSLDEADKMADIIRNVLSVPSADFSSDTPLTTYGIDSLSAARLSFLLRPILEVTQLQLLADVSFNDLRKKLGEIETPQAEEHSKAFTATDRGEIMMKLLDKYSRGAHTSAVVHTVGSTADRVVVVTGTTGALGCNIVHHLLQRREVKQVYALNRRNPQGSSLLSRQKDAFRTQGIPQDLASSSKLILMECDLRRQDLGIDQSLRQQMLSHVTHVIHNAWKVDFYSNLESFEELILGTRVLIDFALQCNLPIGATFSYISTVGTFRHPNSAEDCREEAIMEPKVAIDTGYAESKWVAERLTQLSKDTSLRTQVIRVGLLTGGANGAWDTSHWFPALVQSSAYVGCLPEGDDDVSWLPIDIAASAIVDMGDAMDSTLHVVHPRPIRWSEVMEPLADILQVPLVPYKEWFARLESVAANDLLPVQTKMPSGYSAVKLLAFFQQGLERQGRSSVNESMGLMPRVAMENGVRASATLGNSSLPQLGRKDVERWVAYWRDVGFLLA